MADNSSRLDALGASETIASDDISGVKHQRVKVSIGPDGTANDMRAAADGNSLAVHPGVTPMLYNTGPSLYPQRSIAESTDGNAGLSVAANSLMLYNESSWDRQRGNTEGTALASAARTTTATSSTFTNYNARGVQLYLNVTSAGTGTITVNVIAGAGFNIALFTQTATAVMHVYPGAVSGGGAGGSFASVPLGRTWFIVVTKSDASSWTYSVAYSLIV